MAPLRMDDLKLIELVKQNKHLYDKNHTAYHDMAKKSLTWKAISVALGSSVEDCRRRFRCLRDRFTKEKRATQRSKEDMMEDPLLPVIYKKMMFLWDHLLHRGSGDGNSEVKTKEVVESPDTDEDDDEKPMRILNKLAEFGEVEELVTEVEIHEVVIYNEDGDVENVYHQDDLAEEMDSDVKPSDKCDDAGSAENNRDEDMDSDVNPSDKCDNAGSAENNRDEDMDSDVIIINENTESGSPGKNPEEEMNSNVNLSSDNESESAGKNPDAEMDSEATLSDEHSRESNDAGSAEKESRVKLDDSNDGSAVRVVKKNSHVNLSEEHADGNDAADSNEKVPENNSACQLENSDSPSVLPTIIYVIESVEQEEGIPSNCEVQITPEVSTGTGEQSPAFHSYTKANVPQFKRRRNRTSLLINNQRNNQGPPSGVLSLTPSTSHKPLNTLKLSKTSKAANAAFCTMIKSYLDKINRRDRLSAARLQILKILHDELYSSCK